jgi:hypothetical protein
VSQEEPHRVLKFFCTPLVYNINNHKHTASGKWMEIAQFLPVANEKCSEGFGQPLGGGGALQKWYK